MYVEYHTNNSGGSWWLSLKDWKALEAAGWIVHWMHDVDDPSHTHADEDSDYDRKFGNHKHSYSDPLVPAVWNGEEFIGAAATSAAKVVTSSDEASAAIGEFERLTRQRAADQGCNCCGPPHSFTLIDDEGNSKYFHSEPVIERYESSWD